MTALNRLEVAAGISIIDKLAPKFVAMAVFLCIDASTMVTHRNNPHEELSGVFTKWFADKSPLPTTWQVLLEMLRDIELGELAQEIDDFFNINRTPTTLPSVHLVCCFIIQYNFEFFFGNPTYSYQSETRKKKEEIWQDSELFDKEHQTKPDCQAVAVQISPDCKEVAVQTHEEVTGTASETTGKAKYIVYNYYTVQVLPDTNIMFIYNYMDYLMWFID